MMHPTAIVHKKAELDPGVEVGPYAVIGEGVRIGAHCKIGAHVFIEGDTEIGADCTFFPFSSIGTVPQDMKYRGEPTRLRIGRGNTFREFITLNRGTVGGRGETLIGEHNFFMAYVHVAHDCIVGNRVILANAATLAGHIHVGDHAIIGGLSGIHQYVRIGPYSIIGGCSAVAQDVPPFVSVAGNRARPYGLNLVGLKRHGFSRDRISALKQAYRLLFRAKVSQKEAIAQVRASLSGEDVEQLVQFVESSERGVCR